MSDVLMKSYLLLVKESSRLIDVIEELEGVEMPYPVAKELAEAAKAVRELIGR